MDSLSQLLLGAAVGEAVAGRKAGNRAPIWGAVAGTIPDLDVLAQYWMGPIDALAFHRGLTHSITFSLLLAPVLGFLVSKIHRGRDATFSDWTLLMFLGLFTHPLLDCFTTWGTQLFWPFSDYRIALKSVFVIDPLYTVPLLVCMGWLIFLNKKSSRRRVLCYTGLAISTTYLMLTLILKLQVNEVFEASLKEQGISVLRYDTRPAPFNTILWTCNAETSDGYLIGYYSFLDADREIAFNYFAKNRNLLAPYEANETVKQLLNITQNWYTIEQAEKGIVLNDLRFGQVSGWESGTGGFAFSYHIYNQGGAVQVSEVPRDLKQARGMLAALLDRIMGRK